MLNKKVKALIWSRTLNKPTDGNNIWNSKVTEVPISEIQTDLETIFEVKRVNRAAAVVQEEDKEKFFDEKVAK